MQTTLDYGGAKFALFLGAGFSKWAAGLPVASELFDFEIQIYGPREQRRLELARKTKIAWDSEPKNSTRSPEEFIADVLAEGAEKARKSILWYITRRLSDPFIYTPASGGGLRRQTYMVDEEWRFRVSGISRAANFLGPLVARECAGIVTTNYDMLVEYALGSSGFNYGCVGEPLLGRGPYPVYVHNRGPITLTGRTRLAKLHGSVSWDAHHRYTDARGGLTGNCLIVPPSPEKLPPPELRPTWALARTILAEAERIVFFGFSFNLYDSATLSLIQDSAHECSRILVIGKKQSIPPSAPPRVRSSAPEVVSSKNGVDGTRQTLLMVLDWLSRSETGPTN